MIEYEVEQLPKLSNWRLMVATPGKRGFVVGELTGHPQVKDGWVTTGQVVTLDEHNHILKTRKTTFRLGKPLPQGEPLPAAAYDAVIKMALDNASTRMGVLSMEIVEQITIAVDQMCGPVESKGEQ